MPFVVREYIQGSAIEQHFSVPVRRSKLDMFGTVVVTKLNIMLSLQKRYQKHKLFSKLGCLHIQQQGQLPDNYQQHFEKVTGIPLEIIKIEEIIQK